MWAGNTDFVEAAKKLLENMQDPSFIWDAPLCRVYALLFYDTQKHTTRISSPEDWRALIKRAKERKRDDGSQ